MEFMTRIFRVVHAPKKFRFMLADDRSTIAADQLCLFLEVNILELMELEDNFGLVATQGFKFLDIGYIDPRSRVVVEDKPKKKKNPPKDS